MKNLGFVFACDMKSKLTHAMSEHSISYWTENCSYCLIFWKQYQNKEAQLRYTARLAPLKYKSLLYTTVELITE